MPLETKSVSLSIVVPCYNEEKVLPETSKRLLSLLEDLVAKGKVEPNSSVCFVDDGSTDRTWLSIDTQARMNPRVGGIKLSRNCGHQNALLAGLLTVSGDAVISIDADLQDDISIIEDMIDQHLAGADTVYAVRRARQVDAQFKRLTAEAYYKIVKAMGVEVIFNHADYRLLSRRALEALRQYGEVNLFLRGIVPTLGFPAATVKYDRRGRFAGESKYPLTKMVALAIEGVTSFSATPLRLIALAGVLVFGGTVVLSAWVLWIKFVSGDAVPGWASSVLPMYFLGGLQLLSVGVIGEYLAKIYMETKRRPRYIVEDSVGRAILKTEGVDHP